MFCRAEIFNTLDGSTRRYTFEASDLEQAQDKIALNRKMCDKVTNFQFLDDVDYMYNIDGEMAEIHKRINGMADVYIETGDGEIYKQYGTADAAIRNLRCMGFEF